MRRRVAPVSAVSWRAAADRLIADAPPWANIEYAEAWRDWGERFTAVLDTLDDDTRDEAFDYVWDRLGDIAVDPSRPIV